MDGNALAQCNFPANKASNNVIIVWRWHYVDVLKQELVNVKSFISTTLTEHDLVAGHLEKWM